MTAVRAMAGAPAETLGQRVRRLRRQRGWTQAELGARVGMSATNISGLENDQQDTTVQKAEALATAFCVTVEYLVRGVAPLPLDAADAGRYLGDQISEQLRPQIERIVREALARVQAPPTNEPPRGNAPSPKRPAR